MNIYFNSLLLMAGYLTGISMEIAQKLLKASQTSYKKREIMIHIIIWVIVIANIGLSITYFSYHEYKN